MQPGPGAPLADAMLRYLAECRPVQDELKQILTQVAGFALLVTMRPGSAALCAGALDIAAARMRDIPERTRAICPPPGAAHHYRHLEASAAALARSLNAAAACLRPASAESERDALALHLRTATDHLRASARILPGFDWVDLRQACCAAHSPGQAFACAAVA